MSRRIISTMERIECRCGFSGRVAFTETDKWRAKCPECGKPHTLGGPAKRAPTKDYGGNRRFSGERSFSVMEAVHPAEVNFVHQVIGGQHLHTEGFKVHGDGRVQYKDRAGERTYMRRLANVKQQMGVPED